MTELEHLLQNYGYVATGIGSLLEGETILLVAAFLAHKGYLQLHWVIIVAALGAFLGDLLTYFIGRWKTETLVQKFSMLRRHLSKAKRYLEHYGTLGIFLMRFSYGLRAATGIVYGIAGMTPGRFLTFAALSCVVWAIIIGGVGYLFGQAAEQLLSHIMHYEKMIAALLLATGFLIWIVRIYLARKSKDLEKP